MRFWFNGILALLAAALLLGGGLRPQALGPAETGPLPGQLAPPLARPLVRSEQVITLSDLKDKAVFLNFWATWCAPCLIEMPAIQSLYENLPAGTAVIAVNATATENRGADHVAAFLQERGFTFPVVLDDPRGMASADYMALGLPTSVFVSPGGVVHSRHLGALTEGAMRAKLAAALESPVIHSGPLTGSPLPPVILLGRQPLSTGILMLLAGLILAYVWGSYRLRMAGQPGRTAGDVIPVLALGGFVGAKLVAVAAAPAAHWSNPGLLLAQEWTPLTLAGAAAGALGWAAWELRRTAEPARIIDLLVSPLLLGGALALLPIRLAPALALAAAGLVSAAAARKGTVATGLPAGQQTMLSTLAAATALIIADFARPGGGLIAGISPVQLLLAALGLAAYIAARLVRTRPRPD